MFNIYLIVMTLFYLSNESLKNVFFSQIDLMIVPVSVKGWLCIRMFFKALF